MLSLLPHNYNINYIHANVAYSITTGFSLYDRDSLGNFIIAYIEDLFGFYPEISSS